MTSAPERHSPPVRTLLVLIVTLLAACAPSSEVTELGGETMGTAWRAVYSSTGRPIQDEVDAFEGVLDDINRSLSTYIDASLISRVNESRDSGLWHPIDSHFETVFRRARVIYEDTDGAFNPAVAPLVNAWGFGPDVIDVPPDSETIDSLLELVSFDAFEVRSSPPGVRKQLPDARLDFSAIAKGYAVDAIGQLIARWGVRDYFVDIGGEIRTRGEHPEGRPWRIGIEKPADDALADTELQMVLALGDAAIATSGSYRNYIIQDGRRMAHILDPRTGYPAATPLLGVSVLAEDTMTADAYATAFMVMGLEESLALVGSREDLEAYFIGSDPNGQTFEVRSSGFPEPLEE